MDANASNDSEVFEPHSDPVKLFTGLTILFLCSVGSVGNLLSVVVFTRPQMRSPINTLLTGLSLIDLALLILAVPCTGLPSLIQSGLVPFPPGFDSWLYFNTATIMYPILMIMQTSSIWTFLVISLERYVAVCRPFRSAQWATKGKAVASILGVLSAAAAYNAVRFWEFASVDGGIRPLLRGTVLYDLVYFTGLYFVTHFLLPFSALLGLNIAILRALQQDRLLRGSIRGKVAVSGEAGKRQRARRSSTTLMIVLVTAIFAICNVLPFLLNLWEALDPALGASPVAMGMYQVSNLLVVFNSASTAAFYLKFCQRYRNIALALISGSRRSGASEGYVSVAGMHRSRLSSSARTDFTKFRRPTACSMASAAGEANVLPGKGIGGVGRRQNSMITLGVVNCPSPRHTPHAVSVANLLG